MTRGFSVHMEKRENVSWWLRVLIPILSVLLAMVICGVIIAFQQFNPIKVYSKLFTGAFGSKLSIGESVLQAIPLIFCALGVSVAFRMSLSNIGAEGQYAMGAFAATGVALFMPGIPAGLSLPVMILASFLLGGIWAVIAALPKVIWNVSETLVTLMFNYVALLFVNYWCYGPWRGEATNMPYTAMIPKTSYFTAFPGTRLHTGLILAFLAAVAVFFFYRSTTFGYQMEVIGKNARAAAYAGISVKRNILLAMFLSGGLAGLAGVAQVAGVTHRLVPDITGGAGYTAIVIAYMAHLNPFVAVLVSVLFGGLNQGGISMQIMGISSKVVTMIQGMILLFVLGGEIFVGHRVVITRGKKQEGKK